MALVLLFIEVSLLIVFFEVHDWEKEYLERALSNEELKFYPGKLQDTNFDEWKDAETLCVFIYSEVTEKIINQMPNLKRIVTRSTGFNHINLEVAKSHNVSVHNVPTYGENTIAEHTFALILNLSRKVHKSYLRTLQGDFRIDDLRGFDLKGKTLGIIGGGHIGMHVIKIAKGFGMHVFVNSHHADNFMSDLLHYNYVSLDELFEKSDIISLHVPLTKETKHLIGREQINKMKQGVIIINTSRGSVVDTNALFEGLQSGKIGGAGLDVIEGEELIKEEAQLHKDNSHKEKWSLLYKDQQILRMPNVVFTPHNAFNSQEALERILDTTIDNIKNNKNILKL